MSAQPRHLPPVPMTRSAPTVPMTQSAPKVPQPGGMQSVATVGISAWERARCVTSTSLQPLRSCRRQWRRASARISSSMRRMRSSRRRTASSPRKMRRSCCSSRSCCSPRPRGPRAPRRRGRIPHHLAAPIVRQTGELPIAPCTGLPVSLESSTLCGSLYGEAAGVGSRLAAASRTQQRTSTGLRPPQVGVDGPPHSGRGVS
mmetsp:Transcript_18275/g.40916  ORF Transcript_18275/g.40916 Transcript_18275/m.40916 type:complete len:202 (+) Transcript_18275:230-835(+)